jgi:predicted RNA-binding protein YlqC (UPF0109 family)
MSNDSAARPDSTAPDLRGLIEDIAKQLVDTPGEVSVESFDEDGATFLELRVAPNDLGKVIGKQGRTARAFRNLLNAAGSKLDRQFELEILE